MAFLKPSFLLLPRIFATPVRLQYLVIRHRFIHGRQSSSSSSTEKQLTDKEADHVHHKQENGNQAEAEAEDIVLSRYRRGPMLPRAHHGDPGQVNMVISSVSYEITDAEKNASNSSKEGSAHPSSAHKSSSAPRKKQE